MDLSIRDLYQKIMDYTGNKLHEDILSVWTRDNHYKNCFLNRIPELLSGSNPFPKEESWELYALSRVLDVLTLKFQTNRNTDGSKWPGHELELTQYIDFIDKLGLETVSQQTYSKFHHEIDTAVEGAEDFEIIKNLHPTIMLGTLMIKRGGVIISLNPDHYNQDMVTHSKIYWAFRRKNRKYEDLSHGWGSNSQWRTGFRIDLDHGDSYLYNATGEIDLNAQDSDILPDEPDFTVSEMIELVTNRYFLTSDNPNPDPYPYRYKYLEFH